MKVRKATIVLTRAEDNTIRARFQDPMDPRNCIGPHLLGSRHLTSVDSARAKVNAKFAHQVEELEIIDRCKS